MKRLFNKRAIQSLFFLGFTWLALLVLIFLDSPEKSFLEVIKYFALTLLLPIGLTLLIPLSILGIIALFKKLFPVNQQPIKYGDKEQKEYVKIYWLANLLFYLGWLIGGILSYIVLSWFSVLWTNIIKTVYMASLDKAFWAGPAMFLGILFGWLFSSVTLKSWNKQKYQNTQMFYDASWQLNSLKAGKVILAIYLFGILGMVYVGLTSYTRFTEDGVYTHRSFSRSPEYHSYQDITRVEEVVKVNSRSEDHNFLVQFSDGRQWRTTAYKPNQIPPHFVEMMEFVANKSQLEFIQTTIDNTDN